MPRNHLDTAFIDRVIALLEQNPAGLSRGDFLNAYYQGNLPDQHRCDETWERFKDVEAISNVLFNQRREGYIWIRARRGPRNVFYYHAVAKIENGDVTVLIPELFALQLDQQHSSELRTRIRTKMRSTVAAVQQMLARGRSEGNRSVVEEAERRLSEVTVISARLASINFGDGIVLDELRRLEAAPSLSLLHPQIRRARQAVERAAENVNELARTVIQLRQIAQPHVRRELEQ